MTRWSPEQDAERRRLYTEARTWPEIAHAFGVTRGACIAHGHRIGLNTRAKVGKAAQRVPEAAAEAVPPHHAVLAESKPGRRVEGGAHVLPAGDALTWALVISSTPTLGRRAVAGMKYYDLRRNWPKVRPHLDAPGSSTRWSAISTGSPGGAGASTNPPDFCMTLRYAANAVAAAASQRNCVVQAPAALHAPLAAKQLRSRRMT